MGLADLNAYSEQQIEFTDNRDATVLFLVPQPEDLEDTKNTLIFTINNPYTVDEIIRPEVCLPTFSVDVSGLSGTTVAWSTIPAGSTVTVSNGVYTIDNIVDVDTYEIVRYPTITVPSDFQGSFFYTVNVNYTTSAGLQTYSWQVNTDIPVAQLVSTSVLAALPMRIKALESSLAANFALLPVDLAVEIEPAEFNITAGLTASAKLRKDVGLAPMLPEFTLTATGTKIQPWKGYESGFFNNNGLLSNNSRNLFENYRLIPEDLALLGNWTSIRQVLTIDSGVIIHGDATENRDFTQGRSVGTEYDNFDLVATSGYTTFDATTFRVNQPGLYPNPLIGNIQYRPPTASFTGTVGYNFKVYVDGVLRTDYDGLITVI
jgi:hypothetical protein